MWKINTVNELILELEKLKARKEVNDLGLKVSKWKSFDSGEVEQDFNIHSLWLSDTRNMSYIMVADDNK